MSLESLPVSTTGTTPPRIVPPTDGPLRRNTHTYDLIRQCIHCGFCLPTCPTYAVLNVEMDSPRGRIYQMKAVADGMLEISDDFVEHMNCCVGCRACETACPSGVQYGKLIEAAREQIQLTNSASVGEQEEYAKTTDGELSIVTDPQRAATPLTARLLRRFFFDIMLPSRLVLTVIFGGLKLYQRSGLQKLVHALGLFALIDNLPTPFKGRLDLPEALMDGARGEILPGLLPEVTPAMGQRRFRVGFISGCIMDQVFRDINEATIRVLAANGCEVISPPQQGCCGALHIHGGEAETGRNLARHNIDVFEAYNCDLIIINSAGCGSTLKEYDHLLRDDPAYAERARIFTDKMKDISEFLMNIEMNTDLGEIRRTAAYHDACHLLHGQKIKQQPRQLLHTIPGLSLVDLKESDWCCGSAGVYNITNQEMGKQLLERKMHNVIETGAEVIVTGNPGCMMQIAMGIRERGLPMAVKHPIELLDESYRRNGVYSTPTRDVATATPQRQLAFMGIVAGLFAGTILLLRRRVKK